MNTFEQFGMHNTKLVSEKYEDVLINLYEIEPVMAKTLTIVIDSLGFYSEQFAEALREEQEFKKELKETNSFWYFNKKLHAMQDRNKELYKEFKSIADNVEYACKRALTICGMETV